MDDNKSEVARQQNKSEVARLLNQIREEYEAGVANGKRKLPLSEQILAAFCSILRYLRFS